MNISQCILPRTRARYLGIALLGAVSCFISSHESFAGTEQPNAGRSRTVEYADLDVSGQAGISALYSRIQQAARKVCDADDRFIRLYSQVSRAGGLCVRRTIAYSVERANMPALTALHHVKTGNPVRKKHLARSETREPATRHD